MTELKTKKRVLVTGATGVIGKHAVRALQSAGCDVYTISRTKGDGVRRFQADILDRQAVSVVFESVRPDCLLHLAWDVGTGAYLESNTNFSWVAASLDLLRFFHENGGKRAVLAGTCIEYAMEGRPLREDDPVAPTTVYAFCKDRLNQLASLFCEKNAVSYGWGRIFYLYGAGERVGRLTPDLIDNLRAGKKMLIKGGPLIRDYMYAGDVGAAFASFLLSPVEGNVNIASGCGVKIEEYARLLADKLGKQELLMFRDDVSGQPLSVVGDCSRLRDDVGFEAEHNLEAGFDALLKHLEII